MDIVQTRQKRFHRIETTSKGETEHASKTAHLPASNFVVVVRLQARIKNLDHARMRFQESRDLQGALVLACDAKMKSLHSSQEQVSGHGIEAGAGNLPKVINALHQIGGA